MPISQIVTNSIANDAVTTVDIVNAAVTPAKLSQPLTSGTAVASTSGTSIDFTGIPSWVKRITVMISGVSTNSSSPFLIQIGTSSGVTTSGYSSIYWAGASTTSTSTAGFIVSVNNPSYTFDGIITLVNVNNNSWVESGLMNITSVGNVGYQSVGSVGLAATLDRVRITTVGGTNTFDAGSINILYE